MNHPITSTEIKTVIKNLSKNKSPWQDAFTGEFYQIFREELTPILLKLFQKLFSSVAQSCLTLCGPMNRSTPALPVHHQLLDSLRITSIESVMPSSHLILCRRLLFLPPILPSIRVFSNESILHMRWPKYWNFSY